jgi:hypothetical protein
MRFNSDYIKRFLLYLNCIFFAYFPSPLQFLIFFAPLVFSATFKEHFLVEATLIESILNTDIEQTVLNKNKKVQFLNYAILNLYMSQAIEEIWHFRNACDMYIATKYFDFLNREPPSYVKKTIVEHLEMEKLIEGSNIEYGKIEKCNIDSDLTSKIWRLLMSKKTTVTSKIASKTTRSKR